ncbi:GntR family transcriptional regulator [Litchfieldia alkalitelluris]|uniref:GntR family transcriptional regulator n=1 Tax=Litchfieldia alkalitelluris TaxID=304268 RepID=UPI000996CC89|nr:GntR family transcriptional regulator [Litchfieldia alkalitelluris]
MTTKYNFVKQAIMSKIIDGTYEENKRICSESEMMKQYGVSRHTVRIAISELVNKGWLYREQGVGTFCRGIVKDEPSTIVKQKNIAIVVTFISDYIFPSIIKGAESYLSEQGYNVSLFSTNNNPETEKRILERIITNHFDGIIIEPTKSALINQNIKYYLSIEQKKIPYIMLHAYYNELEPISVTLDDEKGGFLQAEHLIQLGHRNMVGIFKTDDIQGVKRMKGYIKAHRIYNIPIHSNSIVTYDSKDRFNKPIEALKQMLALSSSDKPTGIVCYNDELAIRFLDVFREKRIQIPNDISLVGYDDSYMGNVTEVKLTTIQHPKSQMGELAAKMIVDMVNKKSKENGRQVMKSITSVVLEPKLIVRSSTKSLNLINK